MTGFSWRYLQIAVLWFVILLDNILIFFNDFHRVLDTFDSVLNGHFLYFYMVTNFMRPAALMEAVWSVIVSFMVREFSAFAHALTC